MSDNPTPKRFRLRSEVIGAVEVFNAVCLALTGFSIAKGESLLAILIGVAYAAGKNIVEKSTPKNPY